MNWATARAGANHAQALAYLVLGAQHISNLSHASMINESIMNKSISQFVQSCHKNGQLQIYTFGAAGAGKTMLYETVVQEVADFVRLLAEMDFYDPDRDAESEIKSWQGMSYAHGSKNIAVSPKSGI